MKGFWLAAGLCLGAAGGAEAQHRHHHHRATPWHHDHVLVDPHGHRVTVHHDRYGYVLAPHQNYRGNFYTHNNVHYYYPAPLVVTGQVTAAAPQPVPVEFGSFQHIDELAARLEDLINQLCLDLHYNYQHNPGFAETYGEAYQILQAAQWAHAREHQQDRAGLASTLGPMDDLFHHVQQDVEGWQRIHRRQIGTLGIIDKMAQIESLLHHLMHEIGVRPTHDGGGQEMAPPPIGGFEQAPPPPGALSSPRLPPSPLPQSGGRILSSPPPPPPGIPLQPLTPLR